MDDISTAFDKLTPQDLIRETSAIDDAPIWKLESAVGEEAFTSWIKGMQSITWRRGIDGDFQAFAVLSRHDRRRIFAAEGDETPEMWADRLHREAVQLGATWLFLAMLAPARSYVGDDAPDFIPPTAEAIEAAIDDGDLELGICWVAIRKDEEGIGDMAGIISLDENGRPSDSTVGILTEDNTFFHVLEGINAS